MIKREMTDEERAFLKAYEALVKRHGLCVNSCGCCGSPWVVEVENSPDGTVEEHISHLRKELEEL